MIRVAKSRPSKCVLPFEMAALERQPCPAAGRSSGPLKEANEGDFAATTLEYSLENAPQSGRFDEGALQRRGDGRDRGNSARYRLRVKQRLAVVE